MTIQARWLSAQRLSSELFFAVATVKGNIKRHLHGSCTIWIDDPSELNNVDDVPKYAVVRLELKRQLAELRKQVGEDGFHSPVCERVVLEF